MTGLMARLARRTGNVVKPPEEGLDIDPDKLKAALPGLQIVGYKTGREHRQEGRDFGVPRGRQEIAILTPLGTTFITHQFRLPDRQSTKLLGSVAQKYQALGPAAVLAGVRGHEQLGWALQQIQREFQLFTSGFIPGDVVEIVSTPEPNCECEGEGRVDLLGELADVVDVDLDDLPLHVHPLDWDIPCEWLRVQDVKLHKGARDPARKPGATYVYDWIARRWKLLFSQELMDKKEKEYRVGADERP